MTENLTVGMSKSTKKQHYVPQFYLRQWSDVDRGFYPIKINSKRPPALEIFSRKSGPASFCYENFFYAQYTGKEDPESQLIEKEFAKIEAFFSTHLPEIEEKILNNQQITESDKYILSQCMIFLHFKGKSYREESKRMTEYMIKEINKRMAHFVGRTEKSKKELEEAGLTREEMIEFTERGEYSVDMGNFHHMAIMKDMEGFCNLLSAKYWKLYISREGNFITTDTPYVDMPLSDHFLGNDFFSREQRFILSPRVFIVARNPKNMSGKNTNRKDITGNRASIAMINSHSIMSAMRFGFHKSTDVLSDTLRTVEELHKTRGA